MARQSRLTVAGQAHHLLAFGNDHQMIFRDDQDHLQFLRWLRDAARQFDVGIHAYSLMPNHFHLLVTPSESTGLSRMMQWIGRHYVPYFNRKYGRAGSLFQGRFKASVIESGDNLMDCCRYIESAPLRAELVVALPDFRWTSYNHHAGTSPDPLITDHLAYWSLGNTPFQREAAYRALVERGFSAPEVNAMTELLKSGRAVGSAQFKAELAKLTGQRIEPGKRGRPAKPGGDKSVKAS